MDTERIREIAEQALSGTDRSSSESGQLPSDEIEVTIDAIRTVGIDDCIALSRAVTGRSTAIAEDFALTVVSAGIGRRSFASASTARWWGAKSMSFCVTVAS